MSCPKTSRKLTFKVLKWTAEPQSSGIVSRIRSYCCTPLSRPIQQHNSRAVWRGQSEMAGCKNCQQRSTLVMADLSTAPASQPTGRQNEPCACWRCCSSGKSRALSTVHIVVRCVSIAFVTAVYIDAIYYGVANREWVNANGGGKVEGKNLCHIG